MKMRIDIVGRTVDMDKKFEKDQELYVTVSSVTVTPEETTYFLKDGKIASDFWLDTNDLRLISIDGKSKTLRYTGVCEVYEAFTQKITINEVGQEIDVTVEVVNDFPQP